VALADAMEEKHAQLRSTPPDANGPMAAVAGKGKVEAKRRPSLSAEEVVPVSDKAETGTALDREATASGKAEMALDREDQLDPAETALAKVEALEKVPRHRVYKGSPLANSREISN